MYGMADLASLSVLAFVTLKYSWFLVLTSDSFVGNIDLVFSFLIHFLAKFKHNLDLLTSSVSSPVNSSASV